MGSPRELILLNKKCQCAAAGADADFDIVPAFADDRLTICSRNQEAALSALRQSYGAGYGRPVPGSSTDKRGQEYQKAVTLEVMGLCRIIFNHGFRLGNGHTLMLFREIFDLYQSISNKVVGILARARKNRLIHFEGETLFQGTSDETNVTLLRSISDIEEHFRATKELLYNDEAKNLYVIKLRDVLYNTFCVSMSFTTEDLVMQEEVCTNLAPLEVTEDRAEVTSYVSLTPPLSSHGTGERVETRTARKPVQIEPTVIRLNRGLRNLDSPRRERIVLDFGSSDLVSSGIA